MISIPPGTRVAVYMNLRTKLWSVCAVNGTRGRGKLVGHAATVTLTDCQFIVSEAQRQWTVRKGQRQVHAWVVGAWVAPGSGAEKNPSRSYSSRTRVTYNPFRAAHFHIAGDTHARVDSARRVLFSADRFAYITE